MDNPVAVPEPDGDSGRPGGAFAATAPLDYRRAESWIRRSPRVIPGETDGRVGGELDGAADVFYVHPTTAPGPAWFADPFDPTVAPGTEAVTAAQLRAFAGTAYAPRYRQATTRAFLDPAGAEAYDCAYADIADAFRTYLRHSDRPVILAGHSQGARHVVSLLRDFFVGSPLFDRLVAAYAVGIALPTSELPTLVPAATDPHQVGRLICWNTFLDGADATALRARAGGPPVCIDPLTFDAESGGAAPGLHLRPETPDISLDTVRVRTRCTGGVVFARPETPGALDEYALPGGNLHRIDIELFRENIRADTLRRTATHATRRRT